MCVNMEERINEKQGTWIKSELAQQTLPRIAAENTTRS